MAGRAQIILYGTLVSVDTIVYHGKCECMQVGYTFQAWAVLFPSWLSFIWVVGAWVIFSFIGERRHRLQISPFIVGYAVVNTISFLIVSTIDVDLF